MSIASDTGKALTEARKLMALLLEHIGNPGFCPRCKAQVFFIEHRTGRKTPYDKDGTNHLATCQQVEQIRRNKGETK